MDAVITPSVQLMAVNARLIEQATGDLSRAEMLRRPGDGSNPFLWILGHVVATRVVFLELLGGGRLDAPWIGPFRRGSSAPASEAYPELATIMATMTDVSESLSARLGSLDEAFLGSPSPRVFPIPDNTIRGAIAFMSFHETYHVGQLAYLRKWLGRPGLVG